MVGSLLSLWELTERCPGTHTLLPMCDCCPASMPGTPMPRSGRPSWVCWTRASAAPLGCRSTSSNASSPTRPSMTLPLTMTLPCWSLRSQRSTAPLCDPSACLTPPTSSLRARPSGSQAGGSPKKEVSVRQARPGPAESLRPSCLHTCSPSVSSLDCTEFSLTSGLVDYSTSWCLSG